MVADRSRLIDDHPRKGRNQARRWSFGSSIAAKWPPRGISVQHCTLKKRSAHSRGGQLMSAGNRAKAAGTFDEPTHFLIPFFIQVSAPVFA